MRGATGGGHPAAPDHVISIHAPREGSDGGEFAELDDDGISIHAPREGSDHLSWIGGAQSQISIHAPREGSDRDEELAQFFGEVIFQSTLPVRGATA